MNEIRCPLCGEINPADAEKCRACEMPLISDDFLLNIEDQEITPDAELINQEEAGNPDLTAENQDQDREDVDFDWLSGLRKQTAGTREFNIADDQTDGTQGELADLGIPTRLSGTIPPPDPDLMEPNTADTEADVQSQSLVDPILPSKLSARDEDQILEWFDNLEGDAEIEDLEISADDLLRGFGRLAPDAESTKPGENQEEFPPEWAPPPIGKGLLDLDWLHTQPDTDEGTETAFQSLRKQPEDDQSPSDPSEAFSNLEIELPNADFDSEFSPDDLSWMDEDGGIDKIDPSDSVKETQGPKSLPNASGVEEFDTASGSISDRAKSAEQGMEGLSGLVLPDWLKAMSPIETRTDRNRSVEGRSAYIEKAGPLAGLLNALPAEPELALTANPSAPPLKLQITDLQKVHSQLLEQMIGGEDNPKSDEPPPRSDKRTLSRIVIAICLFSAAIISHFAGWTPHQPAPSIGADVFLAKTLVDNLPAKSPVLVAVEYSPGYSAELEFSSKLIIRELMLSGHQPIFVSTNPLGPILAERLMADLKLEDEARLDQTYINLGFISGGTVGIRSFAQDSPGTIQQDIHGQDVWKMPEFKALQSIANFPLVVIITENPERFREWIEQAGPLLEGSSKLLLVASAQNEPIVRAFLGTGEANQVQGLVSGISGATDYALLMGDQTMLTEMWNPHAYVATAALGLILFLGLVNWIAFKIKSRDRVEVKK